MTISSLLKEKYPELSPGKRLVADYINENMDIVAYCTASSIAEQLGVSNAQIVKFIKSLGFSSYKDMQNAIRKEVEERVSLSGSLQKWRQDELGDMKENAWKIIKQDMENIQATFQNTSFSALEEVADHIVKAKHVGFVASRTGIGCNMIPSIFFNEMRDNVVLLTPGVNNSHDILKWWGSDDILLGVSAFSYGKGFAVEMLEYARKRGCKIVWFTDSESFMQTPPKEFDYVFQYQTRSAMLSLTSLIALYNVLNYLVANRLTHSLEDITKSEEMLFQPWLNHPIGSDREQ